MTPVQLDALFKAKSDIILREDYRAGILHQVVRQFAGVKRAKVFDAFPHHARIVNRGSRLADPATVRAQLKQLVAAGKAKIIKGDQGGGKH